ncbi:MAG: nucleotidyltransferase domain-containing protein [Patescibacteria group bacterium]|nr:nucleotidyltransferase domain-containing protein [Patescibacteria group bacterium]
MGFFPYYIYGIETIEGVEVESDIDVAVISEKLKRNRDKNENLLWHIRRKVDLIIEPYGFTKSDFQNKCDPIANEIKKTGIKII